MFTHHKINNIDCWDSGDFRIIKQKDSDIYNAYKQTYTEVKDKTGNPTDAIAPTGNYKSIQIVDGNALVYATLEEAKADCV